MSSFLSVARFELSYQLRGPAFIAIFSIFFLLTFGAVTLDDVQIGSSEAVNINSPYAAAQTMLILGVFGLFIPTALLASGVIRDRGFRTEETFRSLPVGDRTLLLGRLVGGLIVTILAFAAVPIAFLVGSVMPWLDTEQLGPFPLASTAWQFVLFGVTTMVAVGMIFFTVANLTRSLIATYVSVIALLILYFVGNALLREPAYADMVARADPFGLNAYFEATRYWTAAEKNAQVPELSGVLLQNRLIWLAAAAGLLGLNLLFPRGLTAPTLRKKKATATIAPAALRPVTLPRAAPSANAGWLQFRRRVRFEAMGIIRSTAFWVLLALGVFNAVGALLDTDLTYGTSAYPVTRLMVERIAGAFSIIPIIVAVYYASELVWRERQVRFSEIVDATPTPSWVFVTSKLVGLLLVLAALTLVAVLTAMLTQLARGYTDLELGQYAARSVVEFLVPFASLAALALFLQVLTNNKWLGIGAVMIYVIASIVLSSLGFEHNLYLFGSSPGAAYSDMNGYGHFAGIELWFGLYWGLASVFLMVLTFVLWSRGTLEPIFGRLRRLPSRFTTTTAGWAAASFALFALTGTWIFYNTNIRNDYVTTDMVQDRAEAFERDWRAFEFAPQPKVTDVAVAMDIYPRERRYHATVDYLLQNKTDAPIETVHVDYGYGTEVLSQSVEGAELSAADEDDLHYVFAFDEPLAPGMTAALNATVERANPGFRNSGNVTTVNHNGTFIPSEESLPRIGWGQGKILTDKTERRKRGLPEDDRMPKRDDERYWRRGALSENADWIEFRATVTTDADQIAIAPGKLVSDQTEDGRRTFTYVQDAPIQDFYSFLSARYAVAEDVWDAPEGQDDVTLQVFHHPGHQVNVERMMAAMKLSLTRFSEAFSPFQYDQMRIIEFPAYQDFAQSFPNTVPYSEGIGFIADLRDEGDVDMVTYVTAHEVAHQWWGHQLSAAPVQGATMLIESLSQYSALLVMEDVYGSDQVRRFLGYERDAYLRSRGTETLEELPLALVEDQQYVHYRKGSVVMYALREYLGEDVVNRALTRMLDEWAYRSDPYPRSSDLIAILREEAGPDGQEVITDLLEKIVLYDLAVTDAVKTKRADGRWDVALTVTAAKLEADGAGVETETPFALPVEIGLFASDPARGEREEGAILFLERRALSTGEQVLTVTTEEEPFFAGVDPDNKLIDRRPDDNVGSIELSEGSGS